MTLTPTGRNARTPIGENREARDDDDTKVIVAATDEAISDYGWDRIWEIAEAKYGNADYDDNGKARIVTITTNDF